MFRNRNQRMEYLRGNIGKENSIKFLCVLIQNFPVYYVQILLKAYFLNLRFNIFSLLSSKSEALNIDIYSGMSDLMEQTKAYIENNPGAAFNLLIINQAKIYIHSGKYLVEYKEIEHEEV